MYLQLYLQDRKLLDFPNQMPEEHDMTPSKASSAGDEQSYFLAFSLVLILYNICLW